MAQFDLWTVQRESRICLCSVREEGVWFILRLSLDGRYLYSRGHKTREAAIGEADVLREDYLDRGWVVIDATFGQTH